MNPLDRKLRKRRVLAGRLMGVLLIVTLSSAGIVGPEIGEHRDMQTTVEEALAEVREKQELGREAREFAAHGVPRLEKGLARLARIAPDEDLPVDYRLRTRTRLEELGVVVDSIEIADRVSAANDAEESIFDEDEGFGGDEEAFDRTDVRLVGSASFDRLPALLRTLATASPPAFVEETTLTRSDDIFPNVRFTIDLVYLHASPPSEFEAVAEFDEEMFGIEGDDTWEEE